MKNIKFSRLFAAMMFVAVLSFAGCKQQPEETPKAIEGTWVSSWGEKFIISNDTFTNKFNDYYTGEPKNGYAGDNVIIDEISETEGMIYFIYTRSMLPDYSYSETAPDVGKWYAVRYYDLEDNRVKISGASKANGKTSCDSFEEAKLEFTVTNGYFAGWSDCARQSN